MVLYSMLRTRKHGLLTNQTQLKNKTETVALAAGINGGLLTISVPRSAYDGQWVEGNEVQIREWPLFEPGIGVGEIPKRHWDPITGNVASLRGLVLTVTNWL